MSHATAQGSQPEYTIMPKQHNSPTPCYQPLRKTFLSYCIVRIMFPSVNDTGTGCQGSSVECTQGTSPHLGAQAHVLAHGLAQPHVALCLVCLAPRSRRALLAQATST